MIFGGCKSDIVSNFGKENSGSGIVYQFLETRKSEIEIVMLNRRNEMDSNDGERIDFEDVKNVDSIF